jgi:hypothetical protein
MKGIVGYLVMIMLVFFLHQGTTQKAKSDCECLGDCLMSGNQLGKWNAVLDNKTPIVITLPVIEFSIFTAGIPCEIEILWSRRFKKCCPLSHQQTQTDCDQVQFPYYTIDQITLDGNCTIDANLMKRITLEIARYMLDTQVYSFELYKNACWYYKTNTPTHKTLTKCHDHPGCCTYFVNMSENSNGIVVMEMVDLINNPCTSVDPSCEEYCFESLDNFDDEFNPLRDSFCNSLSFVSNSNDVIPIIEVGGVTYIARWGSEDLANPKHFSIGYIQRTEVPGSSLTLPQTMQYALKKILYQYSLNVAVRDTFTIHIPRCWQRSPSYTSVCYQFNNDCCDIEYEVYRNSMNLPVFRSITSVSAINPCIGQECTYICPYLIYETQTDLIP